MLILLTLLCSVTVLLSQRRALEDEDYEDLLPVKNSSAATVSPLGKTTVTWILNTTTTSLTTSTTSATTTTSSPDEEDTLYPEPEVKQDDDFTPDWFKGRYSLFVRTVLCVRITAHTRIVLYVTSINSYYTYIHIHIWW
jgi:hypothetical protein